MKYLYFYIKVILIQHTMSNIWIVTHGVYDQLYFTYCTTTCAVTGEVIKMNK